MQSRGEHGADFHKRRFARQPFYADGRASSVKAGRNQHRNCGRRRIDSSRRHIADLDLREMRLIDREARSVNGDAAAFNRPQRVDA